MKIDYPRVLILYNSRISTEDSYGVSIREWFGDWPKEKLSQIYTGGDYTSPPFCLHNYELSNKDRRFGIIFFKLKSLFIKNISIGNNHLDSNDKIDRNKNKSYFKRIIIQKILKRMLNLGFWELLFVPRLSEELYEFVKEFDPEIIYCQGYNITYCILPLLIKKKFSIPICFQTGDDWPKNLYSDKIVSIFMRQIVNYYSNRLIKGSEIRIANSKQMKEAYEKRYNVKFERLMMSDDPQRFDSSYPIKYSCSKFSIMYSGSIGSKRWEQIIDLCEACNKLTQKGYQIKVFVFTSEIPIEARQKLREQENLVIKPLPDHDQLPSYLKGSDILFLPESFEKRQAKSIHLSLSTKAHLYMFSKKPIIVYAPEITGITNYAKTDNWAFVITERCIDKLEDAVELLLTNKEISEELIRNGINIALQNHNRNKNRDEFRRLLCQG